VDRPTLIQIVPCRTVEPNGVADYALVLARALRARGGIDTVFLTGPNPVGAIPVRDEWKTTVLSTRGAQCLAGSIESISTRMSVAGVILHFSGYGYQKRGVPFWLVDGLRTWRRHAKNLPLLTVFHELYATGWPWQSAFWVSPIQKWIARSIFGLSSAAITPTELYRQRLLHWDERGAAEITSMPVFSNTGEPGCGLPLRARPATAVVFGLAGVEDRLYGLYRPQVERVVAAIGIEQVFDVGPRLSSASRNLAGVPVISKGVLPPDAVSELLQHARFGLIAYPLDVIGKSGVFATYVAHGVIPIVFSDRLRLRSLEGLEPGRHLLDGVRLEASIGLNHLASIQSEAFAWYKSHSSQIQADVLMRALMKAPQQQ
jgi:hypothetical protein